MYPAGFKTVCVALQKSEKYPHGYERVYLPLHKMGDASFHIQGVSE